MWLTVFSVDGGHRAIKYSRLSGVRKEIYNEGTELWPNIVGAATNEVFPIQVLTFVFPGSRRPSSTMSVPSRATLLP